FFRVVHRRTIRKKFAEQEARSKSATVRPVVDWQAAEESNRKQKHQGANQTRPQVSHVRAATFCRNREDGADDPKQSAAGAKRKMETKSAKEKADGAGGGVKKKEARRAIQFLNSGTELHQRHHVEADVNQATVQKHRRNQTPPFMVNENRIGVDRAKLDGSKWV